MQFPRLLTSGNRRAILLADGTALAVPPFDARVTPSAVRVKVYEYVLRRQPALAEIAVQIAADAKNGAHNERARLAALMGEDPYKASAMVQEAA